MQTEYHGHPHNRRSGCSYSQDNTDSYNECFPATQLCCPLQGAIGTSDIVLASETEINLLIEKNMELGNFDDAISLLDELIERDPQNAVNYNNRGLMHFRSNQILAALEDLTQAIEIDPSLDSAYNNRANCYAAIGDLVAAIADYDLALDLNPANLRVWINQGITFREMNSFDLALGNFDIALVLSDRLQENIYAERGRTHHLRGDWNCAVSDYLTALELLEFLNKTQYLGQVQIWLDQLLNPLIE